jgi:lysophospholipid acyltransferase (LPLAT)-like uncharacterized protein
MYRALKKWVGRTWLGELRVPVLSWGCDAGMDLLQLSWKMSSDMPETTRALINSERAVIYAVYHGRMAGILSIPDRAKTSILISNSTDGEMVARAMIKQGFLVSRGSPTHGALRAGKDMLRTLKAGNNVVVTVDGPRGPAMEMKPAVISLAQRSQAPIVPLMMDAKHVRNFGSWDRFKFPHFFTSVRCFYGEPFVVPADTSIETSRAELDQQMCRLREIGEQWAREPANGKPVIATS